MSVGEFFFQMEEFTDTFSMSDSILQTVPLLPPVAQMQNVMEYCQEGSAFTAILPTCASGDVG